MQVRVVSLPRKKLGPRSIPLSRPQERHKKSHQLRRLEVGCMWLYDNPNIALAGHKDKNNQQSRYGHQKPPAEVKVKTENVENTRWVIWEARYCMANNSTRPKVRYPLRRDSSVTCYVEPSLKTKLRQGDSNRFVVKAIDDVFGMDKIVPRTLGNYCPNKNAELFLVQLVEFCIKTVTNLDWHIHPLSKATHLYNA